MDDALYRSESAPRRRVVPPTDSPEPASRPAPSRVRLAGSDGVRSAAARDRLAGRDAGFRSATGQVRLSTTREAPGRGVRTTAAAAAAAAAAPVRIRTTAVHEEDRRERPAGSRLKPPPARVRPTTVRTTRPSVEEYDEYDEYDEPARPTGSRLKPPPAATARSGGVKARLGGGARVRLTTATGKVVKLKGSSVYSRLGDSGR